MVVWFCLHHIFLPLWPPFLLAPVSQIPAGGSHRRSSSVTSPKSRLITSGNSFIRSRACASEMIWDMPCRNIFICNSSSRARTSCAVSVLLAMSSAVPMDPGLTSELHPRSATRLRLFRSRCSGVSCTDGTPSGLSIYRRSKLPLVVSATFTHLSALQSFLILLAYCLSAALSITFRYRCFVFPC